MSKWQKICILYFVAFVLFLLLVCVRISNQNKSLDSNSYDLVWPLIYAGLLWLIDSIYLIFLAIKSTGFKKACMHPFVFVADNLMKINRKVLLACLIAPLPLVLCIGILLQENTIVNGWGKYVMILLTLLWVLTLGLVGASAVASCQFRTYFFQTITGTQERDERESHIAGRAARSTLLLSIGFTVFMLALNSIEIESSHSGSDKQEGLSFTLILPVFQFMNDDSIWRECNANKKSSEAKTGGAISANVIVVDGKKVDEALINGTLYKAAPQPERHYYFPLNARGVLMLLLIFQVCAYCYYIRKSNIGIRPRS
jgi:hypothetical protein